MAISSFGQKPAEIKRNGFKAYDNGQWINAKSLLAQYQDLKPGDLTVLTKLGILNYKLSQGTEARKYLEYVASKAPNNKDPELYYYLARTLHGQSEWEKAMAAYKSYLRVSGSKHEFRDNAADNIRRCVSGIRIKENENVALVENLGANVNTSGDEFAPLPSVNHADRLYYAAARTGCNGGLRNEDGFEDNARGHWSSDMFAASLSNRGWKTTGSLGGLLNTSRYEIPLGFNADGQVLYFFRGFSTYAGEILADTASKKDEYALEAPKFLSPMKPEDGDVSPYFFDDNTIIFASRREGGFGGLDLWYTVFQDSSWSEPVNFGPQINSRYDETTPFLAKDGRTLYFSSNRIESIGGFDVFSAIFSDQTFEWSLAENMGTPVNSPGNDGFFRLSNNGATAFLSSDRLGGNGERDIYIVYFKEALEIQSAGPNAKVFTSLTGNEEQATSQIEEYKLETLPYLEEKDLSSKENVKIINEVAAIGRKHPETTLIVTLFTENSGQPKFDLYYGIKRAEIVGNALVSKGIPANRVVLRSVGASFPLAKPILNGKENPLAKPLNQRAEISFTSLDALRFEFTLSRPAIAQPMASNLIQMLDKQNSGLAYRVEATVTNQILTNDVLAMFDDMIIDSQPGSDAYHYLVGYFKQYAQAEKLCNEIQERGFQDAHTVLMVNGIGVSKAEAVALLKRFPELTAYIRGK